MIEEILGSVDKAVLRRLLSKIVSYLRSKSKDRIDLEHQIIDRDQDRWIVTIAVKREK